MSLESTLSTIIDDYDQVQPLSGALLIGGADGIILQRAFGAASQQLGVANQIDTKFHIASVTKMVIAAAVCRLVDDAVLDMNDHPARYDMDFNAIDSRVTLHHLLSNTSGLSDIYGVPNLRLVMGELVRQGESFKRYLGAMPPVFGPGEKWGYSSTGFLILAHLVQSVCGRPFGAVIRDMFLDPMAMQHTGEDNPATINPGRAYGHVTVDGRDRNAENDKLAEVDAPRELYSTVGDLYLWCRAMLKGDILSPGAAARSFTSYGEVDFDRNLGYGYGWFLGNSFRLIGGGTPGFRSELWQFPAKGLSVIMLWNNAAIDSHRLFRTLRPALGV